MKQSTPTTAELRAWAHDQGIKVADRGRISSDVLDAWMAANPKSATATPRKTATRPKAAAAASASASTSASPAVTPSARPSAAPAVADAETESRASKAEARFAALEQRVRDLEGRVDPASTASTATKRRFLRRSR